MASESSEQMNKLANFQNSLEDITYIQELVLTKDMKYVTVPSHVLFLTDIVIESESPLSSFIFRPKVYRLLAEDEYDSNLSNIEYYNEETKKYYTKLIINKNTMTRLWELLEDQKRENILFRESKKYMTDEEIEYIKYNVFSLAEFDDADVIFEKNNSVDMQIKISYNGKNIKRKLIDDDGNIIQWIWILTD